VLFFSRQDNRAWRPRITRVYEFLHWRTHEVSYVEAHERARLELWYFGYERQWYEVYDLVDFIARELDPGDGAFYSLLNHDLQDEGSPFRFVNGVLTAITDANELKAVREALATPDRFAGAREHLARALELLGARPEPDYRNTIKEAISSVESTLKILTGHDHADLAEALREFAKAHPIHGALFRGLDSLYGYTSNEHGLRHALLEGDAKVGFAEAKFIIVASAAFVSFLITLAAQ
jgi:hypothetical protein